MIAIVDYGMGNLRSVQKALEQLGYTASLVTDQQSLEGAQGIVLPGVGAFGKAIEHLEKSGLKTSLMRCITAGKPLLGICLGLQLLFSHSEESFHGDNPAGLGIFPGWVRKFPPNSKVPQIGWNQIELQGDCPLFRNVPENAYVYFVHSYYVDPQDKNCISTTTDYGVSFASSVWRDNVYAIQFHPEKSSSVGLQILKNFGEIVYANNTSY